MATCAPALRWVALGAACFVVSVTPLSAGSFIEAFDQPGSDLASTRFSVVVAGANNGVTREALSSGLGAPSTGGVLPIDEGGDQELRFYEATSPAGTGYAFTPETTFTDGIVDAYLTIGFTDSLGTREGALLLRATGSTSLTINAYQAELNLGTDGTGVFSLGLIVNGIQQTPLASSDAIDLDPAAENYRVVVSAVGDLLSASLWRAEAVAGELVETPIDLDTDTPQVENTLAAVDATFSAGAVGFRAFVRSTNSVFFDDVELLDLVLVDGFESGDTGAWSTSVGE